MAFDLNKILSKKIWSCLRYSLYEQEDDNLEFREGVIRKIYAVNFKKSNATFFDFMPAIRFLYNDDGTHIAYTTPDCEIFLNTYFVTPANAKENPGYVHTKEDWDFIYAHECLHQIWDTFKVADKIKEQGIEFDHYILNLASDCVINDYLVYRKSKAEPPGLINPKYIKDNWGIDYDRTTDTQFSLYMKMMQVINKIRKSSQYKQQQQQGPQGGQQGPQGGQQGPQGGQQGGQGGQQGGQGGSGGNQNNPNETKEYVDGWNKAIEDFKNGKLKI